MGYDLEEMHYRVLRNDTDRFRITL